MPVCVCMCACVWLKHWLHVGSMHWGAAAPVAVFTVVLGLKKADLCASVSVSQT